MPRHPRLQKRNNRYFLRVKIPADLRRALRKTEIVKSLGTSDFKEASIRVVSRSAAINELFAATREGLHPRPVTQLDDRQVEALARRWYSQQLKEARVTVGSLEAGAHRDYVSVLREDHATLAHNDYVFQDDQTPDAPIANPDAQHMVRSLLANEEFSLDKRSSQYRYLCNLVLRATTQTIRHQLDWLTHGRDRTASDPMFPDDPGINEPTTEYVPTLQELIKHYDSNPKRRGISQKTRDG